MQNRLMLIVGRFFELGHRAGTARKRYIGYNSDLAKEIANNLPGDSVEHITYNLPEDQVGLAGKHVKALIARGFAPEQIAGERLQRAAGYTLDGPAA